MVRNTARSVPYAKIGVDREDELLRAAEQLLIEKGLGNTTIDLLAKRLGMSKATIYRRFSNKFDIFEQVIVSAANRSKEIVGQVDLDLANPHDTMLAVAKTTNQIFNHNLEILRLIISEANRYPDIARRGREKLLKEIYEKLTGYFSSLVELGCMSHDAPQEAALDFITLTSRGMRPLINPSETSATQEKDLERNTSLFIKGYDIKAPTRKVLDEYLNRP